MATDVSEDYSSFFSSGLSSPGRKRCLAQYRPTADRRFYIAVRSVFFVLLGKNFVIFETVKYFRDFQQFYVESSIVLL